MGAQEGYQQQLARVALWEREFGERLVGSQVVLVSLAQDGPAPFRYGARLLFLHVNSATNKVSKAPD